MAKILYKDSILIIDSDCRVLKIADSTPESFIEVRGLLFVEPEEGKPLEATEGSSLQLQYTKNVLAAIEKEGIGNDISYVDVENSSKIRFEYMGRFRVILGNPSNAARKLGQLPGFVAKIEVARSTDAKGEIDMSDSSGEWIYNQNK